MIITTSEQLRNLTGSFYANNDFEKIQSIVSAVQQETARIIGQSTMEWLEGDEGKDSDAAEACRTAIAYMATLRFYRLNDISHEHGGRKVKIDKENEARPFEWQLARDDRMHLEEYYRALDRMLVALQDVDVFKSSDLYKRTSGLIVKDADMLANLTGVDPSPWLFMRLVPYLDESQRIVAKSYGNGFTEITDDDTRHAVQMAVAMNALVLMARRSSLQTLPYGMMKLFESNGGGNHQEAAAMDQLDRYLQHLTNEHAYWLNEMKRLRNEADGMARATHLQMPENDTRNKFIRL